MKSFILHFKYRAFLAAVVFFLILEITMRTAPVEYFTGAGVFLTEKRRQLAESKEPEFDYIIIGASKSLSLMGHAPTEAEPYSIYNFSMPAMGSRYFKFFMEKYLQNRKSPPAAVIFAGDPGLYQKTWNRPYHDPFYHYSTAPEDSLQEYMYRRVFDRIQYALGMKEMHFRNPEAADMLWDIFSHRYLHFFGPGEIFTQLTGAERIFILKESIANLYYTYRYRDALHYVFFGLQMSHFKKREVPPVCGTCEGTKVMQCFEGLHKYQRSLSIEKQIARTYGQINLGDLLEPNKRMMYQYIKDKQIKMQKAAFNTVDSDLKYLEELALYLDSKDIKLIVSNVPSIDDYRDTRFHKNYFRKLSILEKKYSNIKVVMFPDPYYPEKDFIEQVHYECEGANKLNRDFYSHVIPEIIRFAPYDPSRERKRGFQ